LENNFSETSPTQDATENSGNYTIIPTQILRDFYFPDDGFNGTTLDIALSDWGVASWTSNYERKIKP